MTETQSVPRPMIVAAGWFIALAAVAGLALGVVRDLKGPGGQGADTGELVAPIKAANAQPLTAPPVTEADVRRWAHEEMQAELTARAPKKAPVADTADADTDTAGGPNTAASPPIIPGQPITGNITTPKPTPAQPAAQIPF